MTTGCNTRSVSESAPSPIGRITLGTKPAGERRTGDLYAPFERAGAGDGRFAYRASPRPYYDQGGEGEVRDEQRVVDPPNPPVAAEGLRARVVMVDDV